MTELGRETQREGWSVSPAAFVEAMIRIANLGYYGLGQMSWAAIGFRPGGKRRASVSVSYVEPHATRLAELTDRYDVIVVGAGPAAGSRPCWPRRASGCCCSSAAGARLRRQRDRDHLRNHRLSLYGHNAGPELRQPAGVRRPRRERDLLAARGRLPEQRRAVGGGTRVYGAQAWRFLPDDFRMATTYGVPEGSSLADWPIGYDDLEPYYERPSGRSASAATASRSHAGFRGRRDFPMPPLPDSAERRGAARGAEARLDHAAGPLLINTCPRRPRRLRRGAACVGFRLPDRRQERHPQHHDPPGRWPPVAARWSPARGPPRSGRVRGPVTGVAVIDGSRWTREVAADARGAGRRGDRDRPAAAGSSRADASRTDSATTRPGRPPPAGPSTPAPRLFDEPVHDFLGPGTRRGHRRLPARQSRLGRWRDARQRVRSRRRSTFWYLGTPGPDAPHGWAAGQAVRPRRSRGCTLSSAGAGDPVGRRRRVRLDPVVRRQLRCTGPRGSVGRAATRRTVRAAQRSERAGRGLAARRGARTVVQWGPRPDGAGPSGGQHQAGTCRMGDDPRRSVTDPYGRVSATTTCGSSTPRCTSPTAGSTRCSPSSRWPSASPRSWWPPLTNPPSPEVGNGFTRLRRESLMTNPISR